MPTRAATPCPRCHALTVHHISNGRRACGRCGWRSDTKPATTTARGLGWDHQRLRAYVLARDSYRCQLALDGCHGVADQVDHIVPRTRGGPTAPGNLRAACARCNAKRGAR